MTKDNKKSKITVNEINNEQFDRYVNEDNEQKEEKKKTRKKSRKKTNKNKNKKKKHRS